MRQIKQWYKYWSKSYYKKIESIINKLQKKHLDKNRFIVEKENENEQEKTIQFYTN